MFTLKKVHTAVPKRVSSPALIFVLIKTVHLVGAIDGVTVAVATRSKDVGLRLLACWGYGFQSRREHGRVYLVNVVCCEVEVCSVVCCEVEV